MEAFGNFALMALGISIVAVIASALAQRIFGDRINWHTAFAMGVGLGSGVTVADYLDFTGFLWLVTVAGSIAILLSIAHYFVRNPDA